MAGVGDAGGRGLFGDFTAYRTATAEDFAGVLRAGLVVPDANVLLNLYRYRERARDDLLGALRAVGDRLWVPHQVVEEFWRNREGVIGDALATSEGAVREMAAHRSAAVRTLRAWAGRVALGEEELVALQERLAKVFDHVVGRIGEVGEGGREDVGHDTGTDPVIAALEGALDGRVGAGFGREERAELADAGRERVRMRIPPGYMDAGKGGDGALGDFFLWEQLLRVAGEDGSDVLFVTADGKEDWWRKEHGVNRGPRPELARELRERGGGRLFMLSPRRFLEVAAPVLRLSLREGSVADLERVERIEDYADRGGWTGGALEALFQGLSSEGCGDLVEVIRCAAGAADGRLDAASVYDLCDVEDERDLRGFTRPVRRISGRLVEQGVIPDSAVQVLVAEYENGPGQASGFRVHPLVVSLVKASADQQQ